MTDVIWLEKKNMGKSIFSDTDADKSRLLQHLLRSHASAFGSFCVAPGLSCRAFFAGTAAAGMMAFWAKGATAPITDKPKPPIAFTNSGRSMKN